MSDHVVLKPSAEALLEAIGWCHSCWRVSRMRDMRIADPGWSSQGPEYLCACDGDEPWGMGVWPIWPLIVCQVESEGSMGNYAPLAPAYVGQEVELGVIQDALSTGKKPPRPQGVRLTRAQHNTMDWVEQGCHYPFPNAQTIRSLQRKRLIYATEGNFLPFYLFASGS